MVTFFSCVSIRFLSTCCAVDEIDVRAGERSVGHQADQRAFELADVGLDGARDVFGDVVWNLDVLVLALLLQNRDFGFEVGRLNVRDESPFESRAQALFNRGDFLGRAVRRDHDLLLLVVERVEGMEKLFLCAFAGGDELDIVNHQDIHGSEALAKCGHALETNRGDHFVGKFFRADVGETERRIATLERVADRLHQVRLAKSDSAIQKQRVIRF